MKNETQFQVSCCIRIKRESFHDHHYEQKMSTKSFSNNLNTFQEKRNLHNYVVSVARNISRQKEDYLKKQISKISKSLSEKAPRRPQLMTISQKSFCFLLSLWDVIKLFKSWLWEIILSR